MLVVYKSRSQNTQKVAKIIAEELNIDYQTRVPKNYEGFIIYGFWVDKSKPCKAIYKDIKYLRAKNIAIFFTLSSDNLNYQNRLKKDYEKLFNEICNVKFIECFQAKTPNRLIYKKILKFRKTPKKQNKELLKKYLSEKPKLNIQKIKEFAKNAKNNA